MVLVKVGATGAAIPMSFEQWVHAAPVTFWHHNSLLLFQVNISLLHLVLTFEATPVNRNLLRDPWNTKPVEKSS